MLRPTKEAKYRAPKCKKATELETKEGNGRNDCIRGTKKKRLLNKNNKHGRRMSGRNRKAGSRASNFQKCLYETKEVGREAYCMTLDQ